MTTNEQNDRPTPWAIQYQTRRSGAIGIFETRTCRVLAKTQDEALERAREYFYSQGYEVGMPVQIRKLEVKGDIYEQMKSAGVELANHESDLYVPVNAQTRAIVEQYEFKATVKTFTNRITGTLWFDIPFAYTPFWTERAGK
jgi:hypothetical protein